MIPPQLMPIARVLEILILLRRHLDRLGLGTPWAEHHAVQNLAGLVSLLDAEQMRRSMHPYAMKLHIGLTKASHGALQVLEETTLEDALAELHRVMTPDIVATGMKCKLHELRAEPVTETWLGAAGADARVLKPD